MIEERIIELMKYTSTVVIQREGKRFVARSLELGVVSQGKTIEEATANIREAMELYLEDAPRSRKMLQKDAPLVTSIELNRG